MTHPSTIIVTALLALLVAAPASATQKDVIPFTMTDSGHMVVKMSVNETEGVDTVVDTGATVAVLDHRSAMQAGIEKPPADQLVQVIGLGGIDTFPLIEMDSATLGATRLTDVRAAYNADFMFPGAQNVLPAASLPHRVLDFDFERNELLAYNRRPLRIRNATTSRLPVQTIRKLPFIEVEINGQQGIALVDTGANISFVNSVFAQTAARNRQSIRAIELIGATGNINTIRVLSSRKFTLGNFKIDRYDVIVADPEFIREYGLEGQPVMVLGLDILAKFRLQIDRDRNEILLSREIRGLRIAPS